MLIKKNKGFGAENQCLFKDEITVAIASWKDLLARNSKGSGFSRIFYKTYSHACEAKSSAKI